MDDHSFSFLLQDTVGFFFGGGGLERKGGGGNSMVTNVGFFKTDCVPIWNENLLWIM